jgi:hypothetical protein
MKITESRLRQLIREEAQRLVTEARTKSLVRIDGMTYLVDDDGNEPRKVDDSPEDHGLYNDGDSVAYDSYGGYRLPKPSGRGGYNYGSGRRYSRY